MIGKNHYKLVLNAATQAPDVFLIPDGSVYKIEPQHVRLQRSYAGKQTRMSTIASEYRVYVTYTSTEDLQNVFDEGGLEEFIDEILDAYERAWAQSTQ